MLAVDPAGYLYVTQGQLQGDEPGVLIFDPAGVYVGGFGSLGAAAGQLDFATGIAVDGQGNLVVIDSGHWNGTAFDAPSIEGYRINLKAAN